MSDKHAAAVHAHLTGGGAYSAHTKPGENVAVKIRNSTRDESLLPSRRTDRETEAAYERRRIEHDIANATVNGQTHAERRKALARRNGDNRGAFDALRSKVRIHLQSQGATRNEAMAKAQEPVVIKARAIGISTATMKSLTAGYGTDSATLTGGSAMRKQSLDKRVQSTTVGGDAKPSKPVKPKAPVYSPEDLLKAASAALHAGAISGTEAQTIQTQVNLRGTCDEALLKKLRGEADKPSATRMLTKSQCTAAASKGLQDGRITGAEAIHLETNLALDRHIDDGVMAKLKAIRAGK